MPAVAALHAHGYVAPAPRVRLPGVWFPPLAVPKLRHAPSVPKVSSTVPRLTPQTRHTVRRRVPAVDNTYATTALQHSAAATEPFAASPVVAATVAALASPAVVGDTIGAGTIDPSGATTSTASTTAPETVVTSVGSPVDPTAASAATSGASTPKWVTDTVS